MRQCYRPLFNVAGETSMMNKVTVTRLLLIIKLGINALQIQTDIAAKSIRENFRTVTDAL
jgi:hypothetical protein